MTPEELIDRGNQLREETRPIEALQHYAQAFIHSPDAFSAYNNYGNVLRELGHPERSIPFLQNALNIIPGQPTANFNLAVAYLLAGDYQKGWPQYETRWEFEHLNGMLPKFEQPRWTGEDLKGKTILIVGEQGHGDNIQFIRFVNNLRELGAEIILQMSDPLISLFDSTEIKKIIRFTDTPENFDYWTPIMSIPAILKTTIDTIPSQLQYLGANANSAAEWQKRLGIKNRLRVGFCWSGRRDSWINRHKAMPFIEMLTLIKQNPSYEWINLQADCTAEEEKILSVAGVTAYPGTIQNFSDTAGLVHHLDVVLSVDTAIAHLAGAMGRPVWIMLNAYALDWRWLLKRDDSPWYLSARLFRQPAIGDWESVTKKIHQYLGWYKI
jgi:hypothetical protein